MNTRHTYRLKKLYMTEGDFPPSKTSSPAPRKAKKRVREPETEGIRMLGCTEHIYFSTQDDDWEKKYRHGISLPSRHTSKSGSPCTKPRHSHANQAASRLGLAEGALKSYNISRRNTLPLSPEPTMLIRTSACIIVYNRFLKGANCPKDKVLWQQNRKR